MKKLLCTALALVLMICPIMLVSCDDSTKPDTTVPDNYQIYDNGKISFAYPDNWKKTDGSVTLLVNETGIGNNITVAYEEKSDEYSELTTESFATTLQPALEAAGLEVSDASVEQLENGHDLKITKISYTASANGITMTQTLFVCASGEYNYIVTVTETDAETDPELVDTVFRTLNKSE